MTQKNVEKVAKRLLEAGYDSSTIGHVTLCQYMEYANVGAFTSNDVRNMMRQLERENEQDA